MKPRETELKTIWLESTDSTNKEVRRRIGELDNLSAIAATTQTAGRGQGSHSWFSRPGSGLTFSILFDFEPPHDIEVKDALLITEFCTLALRDYLLEEGVESRIKWPNDIWVGDRKICGILIENILHESSVARSIAGIGLNLNETLWPEDLPNPVSLKELTGRNYDPARELAALGAKIAARYEELSSPKGRKGLDDEFRKYMFRLDGELR